MNKTILLFSLVAACLVSIGEPVKSMLGADGIEMNGDDYLPYDSRVEYLESTGTQYMTIPYNKSDLIDITIKVSFLPASGWQYAFSIIRDDVTSSMYSWGLRMLEGRIDWLTPSGSATIVRDGLNQVYTIRVFNYPSTGGYPKMWTQLDDGELSSAGNIYNDKRTSNAGTLLFGMQFFNVDTPVGSPVRIYSFSGISNNSTPIDLIPVRVGEIGYMYDRVSGELFGNMGTGSFIIGPDVE